MEKRERIAFLMSEKLGDSLMLMSLAQNLSRAGYPITVYSKHMTALSAWVPQYDLQSPPHADRQVLEQHFDRIFQMHEEQPLDYREARPKIRFDCFNEWYHRQRPVPMQFLDELRLFAFEHYGINTWDNSSALVPPGQYMHRSQKRRIVIHPTAGEAKKYWTQSKFIKLAARLCDKGYQISFVVESKEAQAWQALVAQQPFDLQVFDKLSDLAAFIYQSGYLIGNDSGVGHLASALGVPTVTISERPKNMRRWRPHWAPGVVVSHWWLPLRRWRREHWRFAVTIGNVERGLAAVQKLEQSIGGSPSRLQSDGA